MRMLLFFDLPVETATQRKAYRSFVKGLKREGFIMMQKSVYSKLSINLANVNLTENSIKKMVPKDGKISLLVITEKQFTSIKYLLGDFETDVINNEERIIEI